MGGRGAASSPGGGAGSDGGGAGNSESESEFEPSAGDEVQAVGEEGLTGAEVRSKTKSKPKQKKASLGANLPRKGRLFVDRLEEEAETQGLSLIMRPDGYSLVDAARGGGQSVQELNFYQGFDLSRIPDKIGAELGLQILTSPGLQKVLVEAEGGKQRQIATELKRLWTKWQRGQGKGKLSKVESFTRYVGINGYNVAVERPAVLLVRAIEGYEGLSTLEKARRVLATTEPGLLQNLPQTFQEKIEAVLKLEGLLGQSKHLEPTRQRIIEQVGELLGQSINNLGEFESVMRSVKQPSSRGAIAEKVFNRLYNASQIRRKPFFQASSEMLEGKSLQPDFLRPLSRRTLDVKVGYSENDIDEKQLLRYVGLVKASEVALNNGLKNRLMEYGVEGGVLEGHDYVFMPDGTGKSYEAARGAFNKIRQRNLNNTVAVYFVDNYKDDQNLNQPGVFKLETDDEDEIVSILIGNSLTD